MQDEKETKKEVTPQHMDMPEYQLEKLKISPFDEVTVGHLKNMQEQNNVYVGLRTQEEQLRVNMKAVRDAIHEVKKMRPEQLKTISFPYLAGFKTLTNETRDEWIKTHINMYTSFETQYKTVRAQRIHRGDELGEARIRVLKRLWNVMVNEHDISQEDLYKMLDVDIPMPLIRPKAEIPTVETSKPINRIDTKTTEKK